MKKPHLQGLKSLATVMRPPGDGQSRHLAGFTLIELMVVMAILAVLATVAVVVGQRFMNSAKARDTGAMLNVVKTAVDQFALDAPYKNVIAAKNRYGLYPPDELEAFTPPPPAGTVGTTGIPIPANGGTPVWGSACLSTRPGQLSAALAAGLTSVAYRDVKALMLAVRLQGGPAASALERVDKRFLAPAVPGEFFEADGMGDTPLEPEDTPLDWLIDGWGNPVEYFAVNARAFPTGGPTWVDLATDPTGLRRSFSSTAVQRNNGVPFLVSYGPDGADQLRGPMPTTLVSDWNEMSPSPPAVIDDPLNGDNVYSDEPLAQKLAGAP